LADLPANRFGDLISNPGWDIGDSGSNSSSGTLGRYCLDFADQYYDDFSLVFIIMVLFSIIGTRRFLLIVPYYLFMGQSYAFRLRNRLRDLSDRAVEPIIWTNSNIAKFQAIRPKK